MTAPSSPKFTILLGILVVCCVTPSDGITDDCGYIWSMTEILPKFIGDFFACIADPVANFVNPSFNPGNFMCIIKCTLMKGGMLDEEGAVDVPGALDMLGAILPPAQRSKAEDLVVACQETNSLINTTEESCMSYVPLLACSIENLVTIFGNAFVDSLTGKSPVDIGKLLFCFLSPPPPSTGDEEGGEENAESEPEAKRLNLFDSFRRLSSALRIGDYSRNINRMRPRNFTSSFKLAPQTSRN